MQQDKDPAGSGEKRAGRPLEPGDPAPNPRFEDAAGQAVTLRDDAHAGVASAVIFAELPAAQAELTALLDQLASAAEVRLFVAARPQAPEPVAAARCWRDPDGKAAAAFGFGGAALASVTLDANGRLLASSAAPARAQAETIRGALRSLDRPASVGELADHPPVLVLPRVLSHADCDRLIAEWEKPARLWESDGFTTAGFDTPEGSFKLRIESHGRLDQLVLRDPPLEQWLDSRFAQRLRMEIRKVFQISAPMREDYRISCYDAAQSGRLGRHRDNPTPQTRHRLFTAVVALNEPEDYGGGALCFPEYAAGGYRLTRGAAVVWSASLLHEVLPVASGRRFILGTHLGA